MSPTSTWLRRCLPLSLGAALPLLGCDDSSPAAASSDDSPPAGGKADGAGGGLPSLLCDAETWLDPVPVSGTAIMAYGGDAYVFSAEGTTWSIVHGGVATTSAIPLPDGIAHMKSVTAEIAPNGRPLVVFDSEGERYAAFFDGNAFYQVTSIGAATEAHADANGHIYSVDHGGLGLVEYAPDDPPIYRGGLVETPLAWHVTADGTIYVLLQRRRSGNLNRALVHRTLPHGSLTWTDDVEIAVNADWGFEGVQFTTGRDGSLHVAYHLSQHGYYFRSLDGQAWESDVISDHTEATLVDPASSSSWSNDAPHTIKGSAIHFSARDYDHVALVRTYHGGSFSIPGTYFLRRCEPFVGHSEVWPAERFSRSWDAPLVAVDGQGLTTIVNARGARQNIVGPAPEDCVGGCGTGIGGGSFEPGSVPKCEDAEIFGPIAAPIDPDQIGDGDALQAQGADARLFLPSSTHWFEASLGQGLTVTRPSVYGEATYFDANLSASGGSTVVFQRDAFGPIMVSADGESALEIPCEGVVNCEARVAGDGHVWVRTPDFYEQVGEQFEARGGPPASVRAWDVTEDGTVWVATHPSASAENLSFWRLEPGALGWEPVGGLPRDIVDEVAANIEGGFQVGTMGFAADGSFHILSSARCIGTGIRNKNQFYLRSADLQTWDSQRLPVIEALAGDDDHVGWHYNGLWAASYDVVRYVVTTSNKPSSNGWGWNYPNSRQLNVVARCRDDEGDVGFSTIAQITHPGWDQEGLSTFSETGVASFVTTRGLTQVR